MDDIMHHETFQKYWRHVRHACWVEGDVE